LLSTGQMSTQRRVRALKSRPTVESIFRTRPTLWSTLRSSPPSQSPIRVRFLWDAAINCSRKHPGQVDLVLSLTDYISPRSTAMAHASALGPQRMASIARRIQGQASPSIMTPIGSVIASRIL
jgi:hypothetical protein